MTTAKVGDVFLFSLRGEIVQETLTHFVVKLLGVTQGGPDVTMLIAKEKLVIQEKAGA